MKEQGDLIVGVREEPTTPQPVARDAVPMVAESGKGIPAIAPNSGLERFIELTRDLPIEKLEKFLALKAQEEDRDARHQFDLHFAEMQKEYKAAVRDKEVKNRDGTKVLYKFCPLENILNIYAPIISAHGFAFRWSEEPIEGGKRVWCIVSGYGHTERTSVDIPIQAGNDFTNSIQQRGVSTTYGKRYSFINAFGVIIEGEDEDANIPDDPELLKLDLRNFMLCKREDGRLILSNENCDTIKRELDKPEPSVERLKYFHKKAREKGCK